MTRRIHVPTTHNSVAVTRIVGRQASRGMGCAYHASCGGPPGDTSYLLPSSMNNDSFVYRAWTQTFLQ